MIAQCNIGANIFEDPECLGWCRTDINKSICDDLQIKYCKFNQDDPRCGCALPAEAYQDTSIFGPPHCVDRRCIATPEAVKLWSQQEHEGCRITNCVIDRATFDLIKNKIGNVDLSQNCAHGQKEPQVIDGPAPSPGPEPAPSPNGDTTLTKEQIIAIAAGAGFLFLILLFMVFKK